MYIEPSTYIKLYTNIPLDKTYTHTLYFDNIGKQNEYFHGSARMIANLANNSFQRVSKGKVRVQVSIDKLYGCNYMAFQNSLFSQKWFYAFVSKVEYVNNTTSEITFTIDVIQTYLFNVQIKECYIERQHSETDNIGDNLIAEPFHVDDYIINYNYPKYYSNLNPIVFTSFDPKQANGVASGGMEGGTYSGLLRMKFDVRNSDGTINYYNLAQFNQFLKDVTALNKEDSIVSIFMYPSELIDPRIDGSREVEGETINYYTSGAKTENITVERNKFFGNIDGYVPKNKKLFTSPYNLCYIVTTDGQTCVLEPQFLDDNSSNMHVASVLGSISCTPEALIVPTNYKGTQMYYDGALPLTNFPQCAYSIDSYRAWIASGGQKLATYNMAQGMIQGTFQTIEGAWKLSGETAKASGARQFGGDAENDDAIFSGAMQTAKGIYQIANSAVQYGLTDSIMQNLPPTSKGNSTGSALASHKLIGFYVQQRTINKQTARSIDDFFTMYGYAQHKIGVPNFKARRNFTYVKTVDATILGEMPNDDITYWKSILNKGITFWRNPNNVGDYSVDNRP